MRATALNTSSAQLSLREVTNKKSLREYIFLPQQLHQASPTWVPPIYAEEWKFHDPKKNPALAYSDVIRLLAYTNGNPVGRIMGIINRKYNEQRQEKTARFFQLDCVNDQAVVHELLIFIEQWAAKKGMNKLIGPFGFSDKDPQGLQIAGFEHLAVIAAPSNPPYLQALVENEGYTKELDCISYRTPVPERLPALFEKIHQRVARNHKLELVEFKTKRQIRPYVVPALRLVNETYAALFGFVPLTEPEMKRLAAQYMPILDPTLMKVVTTVEGAVVAFILGLPNMSRGIQKAKGKIFPFGFLYLLAAARKAKQLDLVLGAIKQEFRGIGLEAILTKALLHTAIDHKFETTDSHLVLETNLRMRGEYERFGGEIYKRYRVYQKNL